MTSRSPSHANRRPHATRVPAACLIVFAVVLTSTTSSAAARPRTTAITAHLSVNAVNLEQTTYVVGSVAPFSASPRVVLQRGVGGRWSDRQGGAVGSDGAFKIKVQPSQAGTYTLRVRSIGGSVVSSPFHLRVHAPPCTFASMPTNSQGFVVDTVKCDGAWAAYEVSDRVNDAAYSRMAQWNGSAWVDVARTSVCDPRYSYPNSPPGIPNDVYVVGCYSN